MRNITLVSVAADLAAFLRCVVLVSKATFCLCLDPEMIIPYFCFFSALTPLDLSLHEVGQFQN